MYLHYLFPACWQLVNSLCTTWCKVIEVNRHVTSAHRLFQRPVNASWGTPCSNLRKEQNCYNLLTSLVHKHILLASYDVFTCVVARYYLNLLPGKSKLINWWFCIWFTIIPNVSVHVINGEDILLVILYILHFCFSKSIWNWAGVCIFNSKHCWHISSVYQHSDNCQNSSLKIRQGK